MMSRTSDEGSECDTRGKLRAPEDEREDEEEEEGAEEEEKEKETRSSSSSMISSSVKSGRGGEGRGLRQRMMRNTTVRMPNIFGVTEAYACNWEIKSLFLFSKNSSVFSKVTPKR
jgi:hypothetical protein